MFDHGMRFSQSFQVENLLSPEQLHCYKMREHTYKPCFPWSDALRPLFTSYLVHASHLVPGKVAYFSSVENMINNRLTRTSPEMFMERMLTHAPSDLRAAWSIEVLKGILPEVQFIKNDDPDGWETIYRNGPGSCMKNSKLVTQYAHPDNNLALAYTTQRGLIACRTIVNKATKTYLRIYSRDMDYTVYFVAALNKLGYKQSNHTLKDETIYVSWLECERCEDLYMMAPYLDGNWSCINTHSDTLAGLASQGVIGDEGECPSHNPRELPCGCSDDDHGDDDDDDDE